MADWHQVAGLPPFCEHPHPVSKQRDYKYVISTDQRDRLEAEMQLHMEPDGALGPNGEVRIMTQYFDSPDRDCYWENVRKLQSRRKIRVRLIGAAIAGSTPAAFIEIKHKQKGVSGERQLPVSVEVAQRFAGGDREVLEGMAGEVGRGGRMVIGEVSDLMERRGHGPVVQVRFERRTYVTPDQRFRISFDTRLACRSATRTLDFADDDFEASFLDPALVVAEIKSEGPVPYWFRQLVAQAELTRQGFSKYCVAMKENDPVVREQLSISTQAPNLT